MALGLAAAGRFSCEPADYGRLEIPVNINGSYDVEVQFTRIAGNEGLCVIVPIGQAQCSAALSVRHGTYSGLDLVAGRSVRDSSNPTVTQPANVENNHRYTLVVRVRLRAREQASVDVSLDGKQYLPHWEGNMSSLTLDSGWSLHRTQLIGLAHGKAV